MRLKTKLSAGLMFLFTVILVFGILGIVSISRLSHESNQVLKNNHESIVYSNNMLKALDNIGCQKDALHYLKRILENRKTILPKLEKRKLHRNYARISMN